MTKRQKIIVDATLPVDVVADIGCDHGYIAKELVNKGFKKVIISDISEKCLKKAEALLANEIKDGKVFPYVSNGFENLPKNIDCALICGMGGEEIIEILNNAAVTPSYLVLQPMKNAEKLRRYVIKSGYRIAKDFTFYDHEKYYHLITCLRGRNLFPYTDKEYRYGRDNLMGSADFLRYINGEIALLKAALNSCGEQAFEGMQKRLAEAEEIKNEILEDL